MGVYRHRGRFEESTPTQNPSTGELTHAWTTYVDNVPVRIRAASGKELVAAQAIGAQVVSVIELRWYPGISPAMRFVHPDDGNRVYAIRAVLPDETQRRELKLLCETGIDGN